MSIVNEFLIDTERYYREYDAAAFIGNSSNAVRNTNFPVQSPISIDLHQKSLQNATDKLGSVYLDGKQFSLFLSAIKNSPRFDTIGTFPKLCSTDISFHLGYLKDYIDNCNITTDKLLNELVEAGPQKGSLLGQARAMCNKLSTATKRQVVRSSLNLFDRNPKEMLASATPPSIVYTKEYLQTTILPFIDSFSANKEEMLRWMRDLSKQLLDIQLIMESRRKVIATICMEHPDLCQSLNQFSYTTDREIIEVLNFVTYAMLYKVNAMMTNVQTCNRLIETLSHMEESVQDLLVEGVYEDNLVSNDTGNLADGLINNDISAYEELATNIWNFQKGAMLPRFAGLGAEDPEKLMIGEIEKYEYPTDDYNTILEIMSTIGMSLDSISASSDDYLLVCDEIISKSGLDHPIDIRYKNRISLIHRPSYMVDAEVYHHGNFPGYLTSLNEIHDYSKNMQTIATAIHDIYKRIGILEERYELNVNQEYKNLNAIEELRVFLKEFRDQFGNLINSIANGTMTRLKKLGRYAELNLVRLSANEMNRGGMQESAEEVDYETEVARMILEYEQGLTDVMMEALLEEHNKLWIKKTQHLDVIQEIGEPVPKPTATPTSAPKQSSNTNTNTSSTNSNSAPANNQAQNANAEADRKKTIAEKLKSLRDTLQARFQEMLNKFRENMNNRTINESAVYTEAAIRYGNWIAEKEQALLNRSYNNVSLNILPYASRMPFNQILTEVNNFKNMVGSLKPGDVSTLKSDADVLNKMYAAQSVVRFNSNTPLSECKTTASTELTKYYKVGKAPLEMVTYANGELKTLMEQIVTFCKNYYETEQERLLNALADIQKSANTISEAFVTEGVEEIYNQIQRLYIEADEKSTTPTVTTTAPNRTTTTGTTNQTTQNAANTSMTPNTMIQTVHEGAALYSGAVLNAVRDRVSDYFKAMQALVPKNVQPTNNQNNQ